jgi:hypothetical protein
MRIGDAERAVLRQARGDGRHGHRRADSICTYSELSGPLLLAVFIQVGSQVERLTRRPGHAGQLASAMTAGLVAGEGSATSPYRGTQHVGGRDGRKLQHVFSTETRCGPLAAGPSRIRLHQPLLPVNNRIIGKPAGQGGDAHVNLRLGYHAASSPPV